MSWADQSEDIQPEEAKVSPSSTQAPSDNHEAPKAPRENQDKRRGSKPHRSNNSRGYRGGNSGSSSRGKFEWNMVTHDRKGKDRYTPVRNDFSQKPHRGRGGHHGSGGEMPTEDEFPTEPPFECIISDVNPEWKEKDFSQFFEDAGCKVKEISLKKKNGAAYVGFQDLDSLKHSLTLNGKQIDTFTAKVSLNKFFLKKKVEPAKKHEPSSSDSTEKAEKPSPFGSAKPVDSKFDPKALEDLVEKKLPSQPSEPAASSPSSETRVETPVDPKQQKLVDHRYEKKKGASRGHKNYRNPKAPSNESQPVQTNNAFASLAFEEDE